MSTSILGKPPFRLRNRPGRRFLPAVAESRLESRRLLSVDVGPNWSRGEAIRFHREVFLPSAAVAPQWNGNVEAGIAGTLGPEYQGAILGRINAYRTMAGLPIITTIAPDKSALAQEAALMMSANQRLSHSPDPSWKHYSEAGALGASTSNLTLYAGTGAIASYMEDGGADNSPTGHRWWLLHPRAAAVGIGDVPTPTPGTFPANAVGVDLSDEAASGSPVAWPPAGAVPVDVVPERWSFVIYDDERRTTPEGTEFQYDYSSATVRATSDGVPQAVHVEYTSGVFGNYLVFSGIDLPGIERGDDVRVDVVIDDVLIWGVPRSFSYTTTVLSMAGLEPAFADFDAEGVWRFSGAEGSRKLIDSDPDSMAVGPDGSLFLDFGSFGLWNWTEYQGFQKLNDADPETMKAGPDGSLFLDFGSFGLWRMTEGAGFQFLNAADPEAVEPGGHGTLHVDYGPFGLWAWNDSGGFRKLNDADPRAMAAALDGSLYLAFGPAGLWAWREDVGFGRVSDSNAEGVTVDADGGLYVDLGAQGLWRWERSWHRAPWEGDSRQINSADPEAFALVTDYGFNFPRKSLYIDFGPHGLWRWYDGSIQLVDQRNPRGLYSR